MRFAVLGSGSKGNSLVIQGGGTTVLVDAGYAPRELKRRLQALDLVLTDVRALLITHGHSDHVKGARQLSGALGIPTWATEATKRFCARSGSLHNHAPLTPGEALSIGGLSVLPLATAHDAPGSVCFVVDDGTDRLGVCTDLGEADQPIAAALATCQALLVELNHDPEMLRSGPYPMHLKRRIASTRGHLSNEEGAGLLAQARRPHLTRVLLGHLSEVNNTPALALDAARRVFDGDDVEVACAPQHHPTGWLRVRRERAASRAAPLVDEPAPQAPASATAPTGGSAIANEPRRHRALDAQLALFAVSGRDTTRRH